MDQKRVLSGKLAERYRGCKSRKDRSRILDELVQLSGCDRHYAAWVLRNFGKRRVVSHPTGDVGKLVVGRKNKRHKVVGLRKYDEVVEKEVVF